MNIPEPLPLTRATSSTGSFSFYPFSLNPLNPFGASSFNSSSPFSFASSSPPPPPELHSFLSTERVLPPPPGEKEEQDGSGAEEQHSPNGKRAGGQSSNSRPQKRRAGSKSPESPVVERAAQISGQPFDTLVANADQHWIRIDPHKLERYEFVNHPFKIDVYLVDKKDNMKIGWSLPLRIDLLYDNGDLVPNQSDVFSVSAKTNPPRIGNGLLSVTIMMKQVSVNHENRGFQLRFSCNPDPAHGLIFSETSSVMTVIRHRLRITKEPEAEWFKDEGGRDKCLDIVALLVDENNNIVKNREVPLRVTLLYEGEHVVKNQNILKIINTPRPCVDKAGKVQLRVRIEEVSKNHQKQAFCIKIEPDSSVSPANCDVSAAVTTPVRVRSKRSRQRRRADTDTDHLDAPELLLSAATAPSRQTPRSSAVPPSPAASTPRRSATKQQTVSPRPPERDTKPSMPSTPASSQPLGIAATLNANPGLQSVMGWCVAVASGLRDMQWQTVGYEIDDSGVPNKSKPIQRCPSCWAYKDSVRAEHGPRCMISPALSSYSSIIEPLLQASLPDQPHLPQLTDPSGQFQFKAFPSAPFNHPSSLLAASPSSQPLVPPSSAPPLASRRPSFTPPSCSFSFVSGTSAGSGSWNSQQPQTPQQTQQQTQDLSEDKDRK